MLDAGLGYIMQQYMVLSRSRPASFGIAGVPLADMQLLYIAEHMDEVIEFEQFIDYVQFLDDVFRQWYSKHQSKK